jgi:Putative transposase DNA-binding domain
MPTQEFDLDAKTLALVPAGRLSERYKSNALKQAIEIVTSTRQSAKATGNKASCPRFTGEAVLDGKFVNLEDKETCPGNPFDLAIRLSTLKKGKRITILTNRTRPLNKWLCRPNSRLVQGCSLSENWITLWVEEPNPFVPWAPGPEAVVYSGDLGMRKLLSVEDDWERWAFLGREYHDLQDRIRRAKPGSENRKKLLTERDHVIGRVLNAVPWNLIDVFGVEDLKGITRGKTGFGRTKEFRRKRLPWAHRSVLERLLAKATENRVLVIAVYARGTSRECPNTLCGCASALNRKNEVFRCIACGYTADADRVGAHNIRSRTLVILARRRDWLQEHPRGRSHGRSTLRAKESLLCTSAA